MRCLVSFCVASHSVSSLECEYSVLSTCSARLHVLLVQKSAYKCGVADVAFLCRPMRIRKDREVSQQCASSTRGPIYAGTMAGILDQRVPHTTMKTTRAVQLRYAALLAKVAGTR